MEPKHAPFGNAPLDSILFSELSAFVFDNGETRYATTWFRRHDGTCIAAVYIRDLHMTVHLRRGKRTFSDIGRSNIHCISITFVAVELAHRKNNNFSRFLLHLEQIARPRRYFVAVENLDKTDDAEHLRAALTVRRRYRDIDDGRTCYTDLAVPVDDE